MKRYIPITVYTSGGIDCSASGVSYTHRDKLVVEHPRGHISEEDVKQRGYAILEVERREQFPDVLRPVSGRGHWTMFGGNFAYSCDSRFAELFGHSPIAIHDRIE